MPYSHESAQLTLTDLSATTINLTPKLIDSFTCPVKRCDNVNITVESRTNKSTCFRSCMK